jgi:ubiquinol-cytochrome c reductase cytochrome b subunit
LLPALLIGFLVLHLYVFRRHGITAPDPDRAPTTTFWPDQVLRDGVACLAVLATVMLLAIYKGAELSSPANPTENYRAARPEWYFLFLFRFLKFEWVEEHGLAFGAIYVPGALMAILFLMPIIALWKWGHRFNQAFAWAMCGIIIGLTALAFYEDKNDPDHQAAIEKAHIESQRVMEIAGHPSSMIPVEGAVTMLPNDPLVQGPRLFAKNCAGCHHYNGLNGQNEKVMEAGTDAEGNAVQVESKPYAADLGNYGSREWMKSIITDYPNHFAALKNAKWYAEAKQKVEAGEEVTFIDPDEGEMAGWSNEYGKMLAEPENQESLDAIIEYFVGQAIEADAKGRKFDLVEYDKALAKKGEEILDQGMASEGVLADASCFGCHAKTPEEEGNTYPTLVNYGSKEWLKSFISNPGSDRHYGDKNQMPVYEGTLTERELELLVSWMTKDYAPTKLEPEKLKAQEPAWEPKKAASPTTAE